MIKIRKCPLCGNEDSRRINRKKMMKVIPYSKQYRCHDCYAHYIVIAEKFKIVTDKGYSSLFTSFNKPEKELELHRAGRNLA